MQWRKEAEESRAPAADAKETRSSLNALVFEASVVLARWPPEAAGPGLRAPRARQRRAEAYRDQRSAAWNRGRERTGGAAGGARVRGAPCEGLAGRRGLSRLSPSLTLRPWLVVLGRRDLRNPAPPTRHPVPTKTVSRTEKRAVPARILQKISRRGGGARARIGRPQAHPGQRREERRAGWHQAGASATPAESRPPTHPAHSRAPPDLRVLTRGRRKAAGGGPGAGCSMPSLAVGSTRGDALKGSASWHWTPQKEAWLVEVSSGWCKTPGAAANGLQMLLGGGGVSRPVRAFSACELSARATRRGMAATGTAAARGKLLVLLLLALTAPAAALAGYIEVGTGRARPSAVSLAPRWSAAFRRAAGLGGAARGFRRCDGAGASSSALLGAVLSAGGRTASPAAAAEAK